jgi:hypothetical protein
MAVTVKTQKDHLLTEVSIALPTDLNSLDSLMRSSKATGKIVAVYNQGGMLGVNIEQKTHVSEALSEEVRKIVGVGTRELEVK